MSFLMIYMQNDKQMDFFFLVTILHFHVCYSTSTANVQMYKHTYGMHDTGNTEDSSSNLPLFGKRRF